MIAFLAVLLAFAARPAVGVDHERGETWMYESTRSFEVGDYSVEVSGNITYDFEEKRSLIVPDMDEYEVNVIAVHGELSGMTEMFGEPFLEVSVDIDGFSYEIADGAGIVREDTDMLVDATVVSGSSGWAVQSQSSTIMVYTPPYLQGFDPDSVTLGGSWSVTGTVNVTETTWANSTSMGTSSHVLDANHSVVVGSVIEEKPTPAGTFHTVKLVITSASEYEIRWWSDEVNGYVKIDSYSQTESGLVLTQTMDLVSYEKGDADSMTWVVFVGIAVAAVSSVVLAMVLLKMRSPKSS
jgi:hypothetical protein